MSHAQPQPDAPDGLAQRDVAALTEAMVVDEYDPQLWNNDEVRVYSGETSDYVVNVAVGSCECDDYHYRSGECKHIFRARYALGLRAIPEWVRHDRLDPTLRRRINKRYEEQEGDDGR